MPKYLSINGTFYSVWINDDRSISHNIPSGVLSGWQAATGDTTLLWKICYELLADFKANLSISVT